MKFSPVEVFEVAYSTALPDDIKYALLSLFDGPVKEENISESAKAGLNIYIDLLDTLAESSISDELFEEVIEDVFANLDEDFINEVSNEYVRQKAKSVLGQREKAYKEAKSNVIGLSSLAKANKAGERVQKAKERMSFSRDNSTNTNNSSPKQSAINKVKQVAGKVKDWYKKTTEPRPASFDELRKAMGRKAIENDKKGEEHFKNPTPLSSIKNTTASTTGATNPNTGKAATKKTTTVKASKPKVVKPEKVKPQQEAPKAETKPASELKPQEPKKEEVKAEVKKATAKKATVKASKLKPQEPKKEEVKVEPKKATTKKTTTVKAEVKPQEPKKEAVKAEVKKEASKKAQSPEEIMNSVKPVKRTAEKQDKILSNTVKRESQARIDAIKNKIKGFESEINAAQGKPSYEARIPEIRQKIEAAKNELAKLETNEAISDLACLLVNTNISESTFVEIMELMAPNKENAKLVKQRHDDEFNDTMSELQDQVEKHNIKPSTLKKLENVGNKKEKFDNMFRKRFGES